MDNEVLERYADLFQRLKKFLVVAPLVAKDRAGQNRFPKHDSEYIRTEKTTLNCKRVGHTYNMAGAILWEPKLKAELPEPTLCQFIEGYGLHLREIVIERKFELQKMKREMNLKEEGNDG